jgi:xanthine dehydrogenase accessory factor
LEQANNHLTVAIMDRLEEPPLVQRKSTPTASVADILRLLSERAGRRGVLATITSLTGTGARSVGTHMAVLEDGESAGSFSSGCVEQAIVAEALDVLQAGSARTVRFGQGSDYIDIRLPCGGGMDVLFIPSPPPEVLRQASSHLEDRLPVALHLDKWGHVDVTAETAVTGSAWEDGIFLARHAPPLRLVMLGHGAEMLAMTQLASAFGASVELYSPEAELVSAAQALNIPGQLLEDVTNPPELVGDKWTAFLFLFHDHDWEPPLIASALNATSCWVGAMGSSRTHEARKAALTAFGVPEDQIAAVHGPIGLIPSSRDPNTLALSALAEIVGAYRLAQS